MAQRIWETEKALVPDRPYPSQAGQDRYLDTEIFREKRDGVFVEVGGFDGITGSNCLFFELFRDWRGLIVEPSPDLAAAIRDIRRVPCIEAAVAAEAGSAPFISVENGYTQMSGLARSYDPDILSLVRENSDHQETELEVATRPLADILGANDLQTVDYISLDVEGAELEILSGFPFDDFDVTAWSVENSTRNPKIPELMECAGYRRAIVLGVDEIFVR